jgi:hypothetical protein
VAQVTRKALDDIDKDHLYEPNPAKRILQRLLRRMDDSTVLFRSPDGGPVTIRETLDMLQRDDPLAKESRAIQAAFAAEPPAIIADSHGHRGRRHGHRGRPPRPSRPSLARSGAMATRVTAVRWRHRACIPAGRGRPPVRHGRWHAPSRPIPSAIADECPAVTAVPAAFAPACAACIAACAAFAAVWPEDQA